jgi:hypothetical protein
VIHGDCSRNYRRHLRDTQRRSEGIYEAAADYGDFDYFNSAAVRASSTGSCQIEGGGARVVSAIRGDKAKSQAYCQINSLGGEIDLAAQAKDEQKADALTKKINDLEKQLGPDYIALFDALDAADPNSSDTHEILSMFDKLDQSCPH